MNYQHKQPYRISVISSVFILQILILPLIPPCLSHEIITKISPPDESINATGGSFAPTISEDGRYLTFQSDAGNLVADDTNQHTDIFVYDRQVQQLKRVSVDSVGKEANFVSYFPKISADGRFITFQSDASNLVPHDDNLTTDIFLHDQETAHTELISFNSNTLKQGNSTSAEPDISDDGNYIVFHSDANNLFKQDNNEQKDIFLYDRSQQKLSLISRNHLKDKAANGPSFGAHISADNQYIVFASEASNLSNIKDENKVTDVFVYHQDTQEITCVSVNSQGELGDKASFSPATSGDGRYIVFRSRATNLVPDDDNAADDIFIHDRDTGETHLVSIGLQGQTANGNSFGANISHDGRYITFNSDASNLTADDNNQNTDVFFHDQMTGQTHRLTLNSQADSTLAAATYAPAISNDNRWIAFESKAWNLTPNDFNEASDIFLYDQGYYASYEMTSQRLTIPILEVPELGVYRATLTLIGPKQLQFRLDKLKTLQLPLDNLPNFYEVSAGLLTLTHLEINNPPENFQYCQAQLQPDSSLSIFTVTQLNCETN